LGVVGGVWGRRHELVLGDRERASVVGRFGRGLVEFREEERETVHGGAVAMHLRAGQGWHRDGLWVSCRRAWRAWPGEVVAHGNADARFACAGRPGQYTSAWTGRRARSRSSDSASGNRSVGPRPVWWRSDVPGGGRWRAGSAGVPTVGMAMTRAAWGALGESLHRRAGLGCQQGGELLLGVEGGRLVKE
jgi:hypothetical protein